MYFVPLVIVVLWYKPTSLVEEKDAIPNRPYYWRFHRNWP